MIRQCAWCGSVMGRAAPFEDGAVTHSICPPCYALLLDPGECPEGMAAGPVAESIFESQGRRRPAPVGDGHSLERANRLSVSFC